MAVYVHLVNLGAWEAEARDSLFKADQNNSMTLSQNKQTKNNQTTVRGQEFGFW